MGSEDVFLICVDEISACIGGDHLYGGAWHIDRHFLSPEARVGNYQDQDLAGSVLIGVECDGALSLVIAGMVGIVLGFMLKWWYQ